MAVLTFLAGFFLLLLGGETTLRGAVGLGRTLGLSKLLIGMVIIGIGTSLPELTIAVEAVMSGFSNLAIGNILGSSIANALLILGVAALISPVERPARLLLPNAIMVVLVVAGITMIGLQGMIPRWQGVVLFVLYAAFLLAEYLRAKEEARLRKLVTPQVPLPKEIPERPLIAILLVLAGLVSLFFGADLLVESAVDIARTFGVTEGLIGLTVVSFGSILPELTSSIIAARKGDSEVAFGNVLGSILFNTLGIFGIAIIAGPLAFPPGMVLFDGPVLIAACAMMILFILSGRGISRREGAVMALTYVIYVAARFASGVS